MTTRNFEVTPTIMSEASSGLTEDQQEAVELIRKRVAEAGKRHLNDLEQQKKISKATYKIQIWIRSDRSVHKPLAFTLSFWESGKRLHGGGDESMWVCRKKPTAPRPKGVAYRPEFFKKEPTPEGCDSVIPGDHAVGGFVVCPQCGIRWNTEHIADSLFYRLPVETAARVIADWYHQLGDDCDLYVKFRNEDIRVRMMARTLGIKRAQEMKGLVIYPNANIIQECSGGTTVESRFKALLLS